MSWSPSSWRNFPIKQQPKYKSIDELKKVEKELKNFPPLIFAGEREFLRRI